jgi:hypothetical protein
VLNRMAKALVKYVEWGVGHSYTKADFDEHVRNSPARDVANEPIAEEYVTFAVQRCGDSSSTREKKDIAKVFFCGGE